MPVRATKTMGRSCARRRAYLTFATFAVLVAYQPAEGQESSQLPTLERQQPGVAEGIPNDVLPPSDAPSIDELSAPLIGQALVTLFNNSVPRTRGAQDISLFRNVAPSVVLVRTKNGVRYRLSVKRQHYSHKSSCRRLTRVKLSSFSNHLIQAANRTMTRLCRLM